MSYLELHLLCTHNKEHLMEQHYTKPRRVRINPSRSKCEMIITRILSTEIKENGKNIHFKNAMDFMTYFESLYPSGSALTKQVQRAIKAMDLAKDKDGRNVFLADSGYVLSMAQQDFEHIKFHFTSEF